MRRLFSIVFVLFLFSPALWAQERSYEAIEHDVIGEMRVILAKKQELAEEKRQAESEERAVSEAKSSGNVLGRFLLRRRMEALHERMTRIGRIERDLAAQEKRLDGFHAEGREAIRLGGNDAERLKRLENVSGREVRRLEEAVASTQARIERAGSPSEKSNLEAEKTQLEVDLATARQAFKAIYGVIP